MEDGEQYLSEEANGAEREAADTVLRGLRMLRLEEKVRAVAVERKSRQRWWKRLLFGGLTLLLAGAFGWFWLRGQSADQLEAEPSSQLDEVPPSTEAATALDSLLTSEPPPAPAAAPSAPVPITKPATPPTEQPPEEPATDLGPIAQAEPWVDLADPKYPAPQGGLRGNTPDEKDERAELLAAIWYMEYPLAGLVPTGEYAAVDSLLRGRNFPRAFIALNRLKRSAAANDTLTYLTAYTFLELGRGPEAAELLSALSAAPTAWRPQISWHQCMAFLLDQEDASARAALQKIAADEQHPYYRQASKALFLLGQ